MARRSDVSDKATRPAGAREAPLDMDPEEFRRAGHRLVDLIAEWLGRMPAGPVTRATTPRAMRAVLGERPPPAGRAPARPAPGEAPRLLFASPVVYRPP